MGFVSAAMITNSTCALFKAFITYTILYLFFDLLRLRPFLVVCSRSLVRLVQAVLCKSWVQRLGKVLLSI